MSSRLAVITSFAHVRHRAARWGRLLALSAALLLATPHAVAREVVDMLGRKVSVPDRVERVLGTSPPLTTLLQALAPEQVIALNLPFSEGDVRFVGARLAGLPVVGSLMSHGRRLQPETILALKPDVALAWGGTVSMANVDDTVRQFERLGIPVLFVNVDTLPDWPAALEFVGALMGREPRAGELAHALRQAMERVGKAVGDLPEGARRRVYYAQGGDGLATECHLSFHVEPIALAGGYNVHRCQPSSHGGMEKVSLEQVLLYDPDVVVVQDRAFLKVLAEPGPWRQLRAVREGRVLVVPRLPLNWLDRPPSFMRGLGIQWLAGAFYPERFAFDARVQARAFYTLFLGVEPDDAELNQILGAPPPEPAPGKAGHAAAGGHD